MTQVRFFRMTLASGLALSVACGDDAAEGPTTTSTITAGGGGEAASGGGQTAGAGGATASGGASTGGGATGPVCGDGIVNQAPGVEECDDGNAVDADGCRDDCQRPRCDYVDGSAHPAIVAMAANLGGGQPLAQAMANNGVPGLSVAIRDADGVVYVAVFGSAHNQSHDASAPALGPTTLFQAASMGKSVSALAYLLDPSAASTMNVDIRPEVADLVTPPHAVTPADLLSHSAGSAPHGFSAGYLEGDPLPTTDQIVLGAAPATSPGVTFDPAKVGVFDYSGGGYLLWQAWLERAQQRPLSEIVRDNLFLPAGATRSSFTQPLTSAIEHDAACGKSQFLTSGGHCRKVYAELSAAGLWTTPAELTCMVTHVTQHHPEVLDVVTTRALDVDFDNGNYPQAMGLGLFHRPANGVDETEGHLFEHSGLNEGFLSQMVFFDDGRAIVAMDNGMANNGGISRFSVRALCRELGWPCEGPSLAPM